MINLQSVQVFVYVIFKIIPKKCFRKGRLKLANLCCSRIHSKMGTEKHEKEINCWESAKSNLSEDSFH